MSRASVSIRERDKIAWLVENSISKRGKAKTGDKLPAVDGAFYPGTVLTVDKDNPISGEEIFIPVVPIVITNTEEEATALANATEFGLIVYVYSKDLKRAIRIAVDLESGMLVINKGVISDPVHSFDGVEQSGLGCEGGFAGIEEYLKIKYIGVEI